MSTWPNTVTIGTLVLDFDAVGDYRLTTKVEGWGSPARRLNVNDVTGRDGSWVSGGFYAARTVVHSGFIEQATAAAARALADQLAALPSGTSTTYTVEHETLGALAVDGYVAVGAEPDWFDDHSFTYSLTLVAPDPFKRATTGTTFALASGATVTATNAGTAPASMVVTLTSSGTVVLTAGGATLTTGTLPSGAVIDTGATSIVDSSGGELDTAILLPPGWPSVPSGGGSVTQAGTAALSVTTYDTYA